ncbi:protein of unknown function [Cupriavidus taiwanensis]|nr:protein of unknown function [Cupriavidus taiwanensis]
MALERQPHPFLAAEAALPGDLVDRPVRVLQQPARGFEPEMLHPLGRRAAGLLLVHPRKVARAHAGLLGKLLHRQRFPRQVLDDPEMESLEQRHLPALRQQHFAELGLAPGALDEDRQFPRRAQRDVVAVVVFDQRQRHVDAGGHAGRGPDPVLAHEDGVRVQRDRGKARAERGMHGPVRGRAPAVEQARLRQQEGAAAHRGDAGHAGGGLLQPGDQGGGAVQQGEHLGRAGQHDGVDTPQVDGCQRQSIHGRAFGRGGQAAKFAGQVNLVAGQAPFARVARRRPECGLRPGEVQHAHAGKGDEQQAARVVVERQGRVVCGGRGCGKGHGKDRESRSMLCQARAPRQGATAAVARRAAPAARRGCGQGLAHRHVCNVACRSGRLAEIEGHLAFTRPAAGL